MTRILYWNINNFSLSKIWIAQPFDLAFQAATRAQLIVNSVMRGPTLGPAAGPPDIIVVVEVFSRIREVGLEGIVLNPGRNAGAGVMSLLRLIQIVLGNHWCVVPPLNLGELGQQEAVAVFYDSRHLQFTGPNLFYNRFPNTPGSVVGQSQPVADNTFPLIIDYPMRWKNALPYPLNPIPELRLDRTRAFMINGQLQHIPECQMAGEWQYYTHGRQIPSPIQPPYPNRIFFPTLGCRGPFLTQFLDLTFVGPHGEHERLINLFSVHTSPRTARDAVYRMQAVNEMREAVDPGAVNVILGDFNIDSFSDSADAYNWMTNPPLPQPPPPPPAEYTMALDPIEPGGDFNPDRKPYCMTHLLPPAYAKPFNNSGGQTNVQHNVYPRYGYMGSAFPNLNDSGAIDNVFTAYGANAGGPAQRMTIVNPVVGSPYNVLPGPQHTQDLMGGMQFDSVLLNALPLAPPSGGLNPPNDTIAFPAWVNFGKIYSVSDHLPLIIDV